MSEILFIYLAPGRGGGGERCEVDNLLHGGGDGHQRPRRSFGADVDVGYVVDVVLVYRGHSHGQPLTSQETNGLGRGCEGFP